MSLPCFNSRQRCFKTRHGLLFVCTFRMQHMGGHKEGKILTPGGVMHQERLQTKVIITAKMLN